MKFASVTNIFTILIREINAFYNRILYYIYKSQVSYITDKMVLQYLIGILTEKILFDIYAYVLNIHFYALPTNLLK